MSVKINNGKVVYVEPNVGDDYMSYNSRNLGETYRSVSLEDMCIVVDLEVEMKGRTYQTSMSGNAQNVTRMSWSSTIRGDKISFMRGSRIPTKNLGDIYSLTTNYTDIHFSDISEDGTSEMFGIKSVDISYNNYMVPEVTIQFVDVRGVSLFAQEEMRHSLASGGMNGLVDNDIEGSFFKCFFTFPYPKFTLKVKGFYGQMVSYELTCSDFRAAFDSNTGNFEVTAKFIGYAFSFLNDVMVNALVASPYSEYIGKGYWDANIQNGRFFVEDRGGSRVSMEKLGAIVSMYREIQQRVAQRIKDYGYADVIRQFGYSEEQARIVEESDISAIRAAYRGIVERLGTIEDEIYKQSENNKTGDCTIRVNGSQSRAFVMDSPGDLKSLINDVTKLYNDILDKKKNFQALKDWAEKGKKISLTEQSYNELNGTITISYNEQELYDAIKVKANDEIEKDTKYSQLWLSRINSTVYLYEDGGLWDVLGKEVEVSANLQKESNALKGEIEQRLLSDEFHKVFGFEPSVENITKIIMAHVETFVYMVSKCASNINDMGTGRSVKNLGIPIEQFVDIGKNNATGCNEDTIVAPFPKTTHIHEENGIKREEGEWIGNINGVTMDKFEEIQLVEGILNSIAEASNDINRSMMEYESAPPSTESSSISHPLTYTDLFLKDGESPWGRPDFTDINDIMARFCVRAFVIFGTQRLGISRENSAVGYGMADAENFLDMFEGKESMDVLASQVGSIKWDDNLSGLLLSNNKIDDSKNNLPWDSTHTLLSDEVNLTYRLNLGYFDERKRLSLIPVKDWTYTEIETFAPYNGGIRSMDIGNYICEVPSGDCSTEAVSQTIEIIDKPVQYLKNCYNKTQNLSSENYQESFLNNIFKGTDFSFNGLDEKYDYENVSRTGVRLLECHKNKDTGAYDIENISLSALTYDENGELKGFGDLSLDTRNIFLDEKFMELSLPVRAAEFLKRVFSQYGWGHDFEENSMSSFVVPEPKLQYLPFFAVANDSASYQYNTNVVDWFEEKGLNLAIEKAYKSQFDKWVQEYEEIEREFILEPVTGKNLSDIVRLIRDWKSKGWTIEQVSNEIRGNIKNKDSFDKTYWVRRPTVSNRLGDIDLIPKNDTEPIRKLMRSAFRIVAVCTKTKFNFSLNKYLNSRSIRPFALRSSVKGYMEGVISMLQKRLEGYQSNIESPVIPRKMTISNDPDDIKSGVYSYIKLLYDKWIASNTDDKFYSVERMFNGANPTFHFVDSVYTKIGKTTYLNLSSLVDRIIQSQHSNGYTLLSLLSNMYSDNKFLFMCIQNFLDMSNPNLMEKVFKPVPYVDMVEPDHHPNFIVMMPYEPSSKLDLPDADYPDDGFYLNDEKSWPELIKGKPDGNPIPAFGVCYGQQYQNYFKDIQVDMSAPMVTEQSIKAKFMIAGAYNDSGDNGVVPVTAGQDLYTIYANNSYTCTVTMMGCAWVQPMMYFVLQNIPMFHGSYMIVKVNHRVEPGNMITTFKGVRMANTATRAVKHFILGGTRDSVAGWVGDSYVSPSAGYANIANDCDYAYYDPKGVSIANFTEKAAKAYCNATYERLVNGGLTPEQAKGVCANIYAESNFNPYTINIDGGDQSKPNVGGGLCGFYMHGKAPGLFEYVYGNEGTDKLTELYNKVEPYWNQNPVPASTKNRKLLAQHGITFPISFEKQVDYIVNQVNGPYSGITACQNETDSAKYWLEKYEQAANTNQNRWDLYGKWVNEAINEKNKVSQSETTGNEETVSIAEGLRVACQESLRASQYHRDVSVTMEGDGSYYSMKASGPQKNAALMDCLLESYSQWFSSIYWNIGNGQTNSDAVSIDVHVVDKKPDTVTVGIASNRDSVASITNKDELNEDLRLILTKYFKKNGINSPEAVKSIFMSCNMTDDDTIGVFELGDTKSTRECKEVMGYDYTQIAEYRKGDGTYNPEAACSYITNHSYDRYIEGYCGYCARNVREAMEAGGMNTTGHPEWAWKYIGYLPKKGFKHVGRFYGKNIDSPMIGDIAVYKKNGMTGYPGHICMYDGNRWVSDFKQNNLVVYENPQEVDIFRYSTEDDEA